MLNKSKGNMYSWVTHTWNAIKGKCPHDCSYCYMKRFPQKELHFDEKELKTDLGSGNFIFAGSSCDMWASQIDGYWISRILDCCIRHPGNKYLYQSKNPRRFPEFKHWYEMPNNFILGTTIETNRTYSRVMGKAQTTYYRHLSMSTLKCHKMVSIEPIMDFDLEEMVCWMQEIKPEFISIGADSGNNHLPEPSPDKVEALIEALRGITEVKVKHNLARLLPHQEEG